MDKNKLTNYQLIATFLYIISLFLSIILTYNDKSKILDDKKARFLSIFNRVFVVSLTLTFLYINYKGKELAKENSQNLSAFNLQIMASELSVLASLIVLYVVISSSDYSLVAGAENPNL